MVARQTFYSYNRGGPMRIPFFLLPLFVCASVAAQKPCARYSFDAPRVYAPEGFHHRNVIADFDGDGRLDIGSTDDGRFSLRFQNVAGTFGSAEVIEGWVWSAGDVIGDYRLPVPCQPGERFAFLDQAHYSMVKTTTFNGVPLPSIWLWDSETDALECIKRFEYEDFRNRWS